MREETKMHIKIALTDILDSLTHLYRNRCMSMKQSKGKQLYGMRQAI